MYQAVPIPDSPFRWKWKVTDQQGKAVAFAVEETTAANWAEQMNSKGFINIDVMDLMSE